jgi:hypothetical protein
MPLVNPTRAGRPESRFRRRNDEQRPRFCVKPHADARLVWLDDPHRDRQLESWRDEKWCAQVLGSTFTASLRQPAGEYHLFAYSDQGRGGIRSTNARRVHVSARHRRDLGDIGELANPMRDSSERYEVSRSSRDPTQQVVRIKWDSEDGHLSGFCQSPEFRRIFEAVGPFVHDIQDYEIRLSSAEGARR